MGLLKKVPAIIFVARVFSYWYVFQGGQSEENVRKSLFEVGASAPIIVPEASLRPIRKPQILYFD